RGVPLMADLHRPGTHPLLALRQPAIPGIAHIIQEHRQRALIRPDRRMRPSARAAPRLHLLRRPRPRPRHRESLEPADQPLPALNQRPAQPAAPLLPPPSPPASTRTTPAPAAAASRHPPAPARPIPRPCAPATTGTPTAPTSDATKPA